MNQDKQHGAYRDATNPDRVEEFGALGMIPFVPNW